MLDNLETEIRAALAPFFGPDEKERLDKAADAVAEVARLHIEAAVVDAQDRLGLFLTGANEQG